MKGNLCQWLLGITLFCDINMGLPRPNYDNLVSYLTVWSLAGKWEKELKTYIDVYENIINFNVIMVSIHKDWYLIV